VCAWEYQRRGVVHIHALLGDVGGLNVRARRLDWKDRWDTLAGFAKVEAIRQQDSVQRYCTKYIAKGGRIDLSDSLKNFAQQQALSNP
jgi:hypothetical protein